MGNRSHAKLKRKKHDDLDECIECMNAVVASGDAAQEAAMEAFDSNEPEDIIIQAANLAFNKSVQLYFKSRLDRESRKKR